MPLSTHAQAVAVAIDTSKTDGKPAVDPSKPTTTIQFRFHNGQRATLDVNLDHTVADLTSYVKRVAPVKGDF